VFRKTRFLFRFSPHPEEKTEGADMEKAALAGRLQCCTVPVSTFGMYFDGLPEHVDTQHGIFKKIKT
jgi:hypothetical protein